MPPVIEQSVLSRTSEALPESASSNVDPSPPRRGFAARASCLGLACLALLGCSESSKTKATSAPEPLGKANAALTNASADGETGVYWVVLRERAEVRSAQAITNWSDRGAYVRESLQATAQTSQANLLNWLETRGIEHRSFWIANTVKIVTDATTAAEIGQRADVVRVREDRTYSIPEPQPGALVKPEEADWGGRAIRARETWDTFGTRGEGIVVANVDTGVDYQHAALVNQYRGNTGDGSFEHEYNWFSLSGFCGGQPCDSDQHGTHTMGTIVGNDGADAEIGIAPDAQWIAAMGCQGFGCSEEDLLTSGEWMVAPTDANGENPRPDLRPHVVNNSWGGAGYDPFYEEIVRAWVAAGIFPVFSAGNSGNGCGSVGSPADYPESYSVAAFDEFDQIAGFSSRGDTSSELSGKPEIAAPGVDVLSSVPGGGYERFSGTSMAAPHLAGTVALMWSAAPSLVGDVATTRELLGLSAINVDDTSCGGDEEFNGVWGEGKLDAFAAVEISPRGPSGSLAGNVLTTGGEPISGAAVRAVSPDNDRLSRSSAEGSYSFRLPIGTFDVSASAFGYLPSTPRTAEVLEGQETRRNFRLASAPLANLSGTVTDSQGAALAHVSIALPGTPLPAAVTDDNGHYEFIGVPFGSYEGVANSGACYTVAREELELNANLVVDFQLEQSKDAFGYGCLPIAFEYVEATDPLGLAGINALTGVDLPFPFAHYGQIYERAFVTTSGFVSFSDASSSDANGPIPSDFQPNAALYAFWDTFIVDPGFIPGEIFTQTLGDAPNRKFVIEYRDVTLLQDFETTVRFEIVLHENGTVDFVYPGGTESALARGSSATVGLEDAEGLTAFQFSNNAAFIDGDMAIRFAPPPSGVLTGAITSSTDGQPIGNVLVNVLDGEDVVRTGRTNEEGSYRVQVPVGTFTLQASKTNYSTGTGSVEMEEDETQTRDFVLDTAAITLSERTVQLTMVPGERRTRSFVLGNLGVTDLDFTIDEAGGRSVSTIVSRTQKTAGTLAANARDTRALFGTNFISSASQPMAVGDVISEFTPDVFVEGLGVVGDKLWVATFDCTALGCGTVNHEYTQEGEPTGVSWFLGDNREGYGMSYDENTNLMCQVGINFSNAAIPEINCWDPTTGETQMVVSGPDWSNRFLRALAHDPQEDVYFVSDFGVGVLRVAGSSWPNPGELLGSCEPADNNISGLAWNGSAQVLWAATNSPDDTIYQLNPEDCTVLDTLGHPDNSSFSGGKLDMNPDGNLWMQNQNSRTVLLVDSGLPTLNDVPWLTVTPESGSLATGVEQEVVLTIDTTGLAPGQYLASLVISSNAALESNVRIPISLLVPAYRQAVNAGGADYVDGFEDLWSVDQAYTEGDWGYVGNSSSVQTLRSISGSDEPELHQFQRMGLYAYRFDSLPDGVYEVELAFAEVEKRASFNERLFDVIVEDELVLPAYDIAFDVGTYTLDEKRYFVEVQDGRMDVRLVGRNDSKPPVINALRLSHRPDR